MRLDKFLCEMNVGTRSQVKHLIRRGLVTVNGRAAADADLKIDELNDSVCVQGRALKYRKFVYYMLNKPAGVVSATRDDTEDTVVGLLDSDRDVFPVGRLDKDATGLLLLTDDGELAHRLLAPGKHVDKVYRVQVEHPLSDGEKLRLERGVDIGDDTPTLPAGVEILSETELFLTIHEGRFHQVKRMLRAVDNQVISLRRVKFGGLDLDETLKPGEYRELTEREVQRLHGISFESE